MMWRTIIGFAVGVAAVFGAIAWIAWRAWRLK